MMRKLFVLCAGAVLSIAVTGCSLRAPSYNPVLGGFSKPVVYAGEAMPIILALDSESSSDARAKPRSLLTAE
jgi:hypothetical protein